MVALSEKEVIIIVLSSQYCVIVEAVEIRVLPQLLYSSQIKKWSLDSSNKQNFVNPMRENHFVWLNARCLILSITAQITCVFEQRHLKETKYIWSDLHFIVDEKVKILHFHDEDKSWWSSILYHSVANANRHLYILVLILPQLVIDCFEL